VEEGGRERIGNRRGGRGGVKKREEKGTGSRKRGERIRRKETTSQ